MLMSQLTMLVGAGRKTLMEVSKWANTNSVVYIRKIQLFPVATPVGCMLLSNSYKLQQ